MINTYLFVLFCFIYAWLGFGDSTNRIKSTYFVKETPIVGTKADCLEYTLIALTTMNNGRRAEYLYVIPFVIATGNAISAGIEPGLIVTSLPLPRFPPDPGELLQLGQQGVDNFLPNRGLLSACLIACNF
jgi:hypothetical protein